MKFLTFLSNQPDNVLTRALNEGKRALVTARLQKRLRQGGFRNFKEYVRYVQPTPAATKWCCCSMRLRRRSARSGLAFTCQGALVG